MSVLGLRLVDGASHSLWCAPVRTRLSVRGRPTGAATAATLGDAQYNHGCLQSSVLSPAPVHLCNFGQTSPPANGPSTGTVRTLRAAGLLPLWASLPVSATMPCPLQSSDQNTRCVHGRQSLCTVCTAAIVGGVLCSALKRHLSLLPLPIPLPPPLGAASDTLPPCHCFWGC